jgi:integrase
MPRKRTRKDNVGLPRGWRWDKGAYRYQVPQSQRHNWDNKVQFTLGKTLTEAYRVWAERLQLQRDARTVGELLEQYAVQVVPTKAPRTRENNLISINRLSKVFADMPIHQLKPHHVYKYFNEYSKHAHRAAEMHVALLRHAYTKAVEWGLIDQNPIKGQVRIQHAQSQTRYVEDWEIKEFLKVADNQLALYVELHLMTGLRRSDILLLKRTDLKDDAIHITPSKTQKSSRIKVRIQWTKDLRELIDEILALPRKVGSLYLFCNRDGKPYHDVTKGTANGWDSLWQRTMKKALAETNLTERFTDKSLRNKSLTDDSSLENASKRGGHTEKEITKMVYRLRGEQSLPNPRKSKSR